MTRETEHQRYKRLLNVLDIAYDEKRSLTTYERREFSEMLVRNMTAYDYNCHVQDIGDWIHERGLPYPDDADLDDERYVNEHYDRALSALPFQCEHNLSDDEVIHLFFEFVDEPDVGGEDHDKYEFKPRMREISGMGGSYERCCRTMIKAGLEWFDKHPDADPQFYEYEGIYGLISEDNEDACDLSHAVTEVVDGCSGAMHQATIAHILHIHKVGWDTYVEEMVDL